MDSSTPLSISVVQIEVSGLFFLKLGGSWESILEELGGGVGSEYDQNILNTCIKFSKINKVSISKWEDVLKSFPLPLWGKVIGHW